MNGLMYQASFENVLVGAIDDNYFELTLGSAAIKIHFIRVSADPAGVTKIRVRLGTLGAASSGGTALSEVPLQRRNTVAAQTAVETDTNGGSVGGEFNHQYWNLETVFIYHPTEETRIILDSTESNFVMNSVTGINRNCSGTIIWEEL